MDMTLRWFGEGVDSVSLEQIRQIPGVKGVITTLYDIPAGEVWPMERILQMKEQVESRGLKVLGIESVNIHDAIKVGTPDREQYIANYITTLERLGQAGIHVVCYNFMPVLTGPVPIWLRSDRTAPRYWLTARRRSIRLILRICSRPWEKSPTDLSFPDGSLSAWRALKSCLTCIRTWMRTVSLTIWCIFSRQSSRYVRSMTLRWPYIPMTRHGPYSD